MYYVVAWLVLLFVVFCYWYFTKEHNYWRKRNVQFIEPYPIIGNIYSVITEKESIGEFLHSLYEKTTKPYLGFFILNQPSLLIRDPELIKSILIKDFDHFADRTAVENNYDPYGQHLLLLTKETQWKPLRKSVTPLFSTGRNKIMLPLIEEVCDRLVTRINDTVLNKKSTDCTDVCMRFAVDITTNCFFGLNGHSLDSKDSEYFRMSQRFANVDFLRNIQMAFYFIAPLFVKTFRMKFLDPRASNFMHNVVLQCFQQRKLRNEDRGDLIDNLLKTYDEGPKTVFEQNKLVAMFIQFLTAGFETSGNSLAFAVFELSRHQAIQTRVRNEIKKALETHGSITYEMLEELKYLDMFVKEISRKYPLLPFLDRRCIKEYKLPGHDLVIEKGRGVYISLLGLHYDEKYFPNPEKFDPERFSEVIPQQCTYLPFGGGLRKCIGSRFALLSTKMVLVKMLLKLHIDKSEDAVENVTFAHNWIFLVPEGELNIVLILEKTTRKDLPSTTDHRPSATDHQPIARAYRQKTTMSNAEAAPNHLLAKEAAATWWERAKDTIATDYDNRKIHLREEGPPRETTRKPQDYAVVITGHRLRNATATGPQEADKDAARKVRKRNRSSMTQDQGRAAAQEKCNYCKNLGHTVDQ
ncbi:hypothetical protein FQR65_LT06145 [Abscondita terminalis]|nr:hypothetical protein FQR65_LT06145 [Abscondita terminalis]